MSFSVLMSDIISKNCSIEYPHSAPINKAKIWNNKYVFRIFLVTAVKLLESPAQPPINKLYSVRLLQGERIM